MATIARFQGGHFDGADMHLDPNTVLRRHIYLRPPPPPMPIDYAPLATVTELPPTLTYRAVSTGYAGENYIIIYRLEE